MKVIYLSNSLGRKAHGGSSLSGLRFLEMLERKFDQVTVVTDEWRSPPPSTAQRRVELARVDIVRHGWALKQLAKVAILALINLGRRRQIRIAAGTEDVLLIANSFTTLHQQLLIQTTGRVIKACVVRGDTSSFLYQGWGDDPADYLAKPKQFLLEFDGIIYVSKTIQVNWLAAGIDRPHWYLPNSIDEDEVRRVRAVPWAETRARLGFDPAGLHIVVVGSLQERKGQDLFARIAARLFAALPQLTVHFVGVVSAPFGGTRLVGLLQDAGQQRFIIHGHKDNALEYVHGADLVVSTSKSEAFPRTVAEYLAMARPIISTRVAGADEMIEHGRNGLLIEIDDADALLESILTLAGDAPLRATFAQAAEATYGRLYSAQRQQEHFSAIIDQLVGI